MLRILQEELRLTKNFIRACIETLDENHLRYYRCILNLYEVIIMDIEPLLHISQFDFKCLIKNEIITFDPLNDKTYKLIREITFS